MKEIERKFLVDKKKWTAIAKPEPILIIQGYISKTESNVVRIRTKDQKAYLTIKSATVGISRNEYEYEVPINEAQEMIQQFCPKYIQKNRYEIPFSKHLWEVDEFILPNKGLLLAEIELKSEHEQFSLPDWLGKEVSHDPSYFNSNML